jgi:transposase-like protein
LVVSVEAKQLALERIANGEAASAVARDLGVHRQRLYEWQRRVREDGVKALRGPGRPAKPVIRDRPRRNAIHIAAMLELLARLSRTTGERSGDPR